MSRVRRAYTLIEVLFGAGLLGLLTALFVGVLVPVLRASARNATRIGVQEGAMVALQRLSKDLQSSTVAGVGLLEGDPCVLSVHRLADVVTTDPPSQVYENQFVVYCYVSSQARLTRRVWPETSDPNQTLDGLLKPPGSLQPVRPEPRSLAYFAAHPGSRDQNLVSQVKSFAIGSKVAAPQVTPPLQIRLELEAPLWGGEKYRLSLSQSVSLRHSE